MKGDPRANPPDRGPGGAIRPSTNRYGLDFGQCWERAKRRIRNAAGLDVEREARAVKDPVQRARRLAEVAAPADMRASLALGLGAEASELERDKGGARLILEAAHRRMSIVGLRSGDVQEHELSERFTDFMARFMAPDARARRRELDAGPPALPARSTRSRETR